MEDTENRDVSPPQPVSEQELLKQRFGHIPTRAEFLRSQLKQRRYFDSGDYAMSRASKKPAEVPDTGREHPVPERIPHHEAAMAHAKSSPVRRSSTLGPNR